MTSESQKPAALLRAALLLVLALTLSRTVSSAAPQEFASAAARTHLLELFTSEGCSSCPPAEAWLADLHTSPGLWRDFVPVAWHVDYWDRLGWKDRYASRAFTQRQHAYAAAWHSRSVYTPCFALDGGEWSASAKPPRASTAPAGILRARYENSDLTVTFTPPASASTPTGDYEVHAAVLASNLASRVTAGENSGRTLRHGFIVRATTTAALREGTARLTLAPPPSTPAESATTRFALAIWVTHRGDLTPLQATGGWL